MICWITNKNSNKTYSLIPHSHLFSLIFPNDTCTPKGSMAENKDDSEQDVGLEQPISQALQGSLWTWCSPSQCHGSMQSCWPLLGQFPQPFHRNIMLQLKTFAESAHSPWKMSISFAMLMDHRHKSSSRLASPQYRFASKEKNRHWFFNQQISFCYNYCGEKKIICRYSRTWRKLRGSTGKERNLFLYPSQVLLH